MPTCFQCQRYITLSFYNMTGNAYELNFTLIRVSGFWKARGRWRWIYAIYQAIVLCGYLILLISELIALYKARGNILVFNDIMCTMSAVGLIVFKAAFLLPTTGRVLQVQTDFDFLLNVPRTGFNFHDQKILDRATRKIHVLGLFTTSAMAFTALLWALFPLIDNAEQKLPLPFWWPGDLTRYPIYQILYLYHIAVLLSASLCLAGTDVMFCSFLIQTSAHYDVLIRRMTELSDWKLINYRRDCKDTHFAIDKGLSHCIYHHQAIIRIIGVLEEIYRGPVLVQLVGGTILVCVAGFEIFVLTTEINIQICSRLFYLTIALLDLYIYCFVGDIIIKKSEDVAKAAYNLPWAQLPWHQQHAVLIILTQARRPPHISAGRLFSLNLVTYLGVLKTAYNLFALLRQVATKP